MTGQEPLKSYSAIQALNSGFSLQPPFLLTGLKPKPMNCDAVIRILPGRRLVLLAEDQGQKFILKLMGQGAYAQREYDLELKGYKAITSAGILTPAIVDHATHSDQGTSFVAFHFIDGATTLSDGFRDAGDAEKKRLLESVFQIIANMHNAGIYQQDIHLDNFLHKGEMIYTLDCASVSTSSGQSLSDKSAIANLGLFIAQIYPHLDHLVETCFQHYLDARQTTRLSFSQVYQSALSARKKRARRYRRKIFRSSSAHLCKQNWNEFRICRREHYDQQMMNFLDNPDSAIAAGRVIKAGNSATVAQVQIGSTPYLVKRYNLKNYWHGIKRMLQTSRAWRSWRAAYSLDLVGIDTPQAIALMEKRKGPFRGKSYLVCEFLAPEKGAYLDQLIENGLTFEQGQALFQPLFAKMETASISHGDFKATNFFIQVDKIFVLDLDAMTLHCSKTRCNKALSKDRNRFTRNWNKA